MPIPLCTDPTCYNYQRYCRLHRTETYKGTAPIKAESDSRKEINKQYQQKAKGYIKRNPKCKVCGAAAVCVHHKKGRVGDNLLDEKTWLAVCLECHRRIEENPAWAIENGYSISRHIK